MLLYVSNNHALHAVYTMQISLASTVNKHSPIYMLKVQHIKKTADHGTLWVKEIEAPFTKWFTADGQFVPKPFQRWLLDEIPVIGKD